MFTSSPNAWFAVQVVPKCEMRVATLLECKGYESFFPKHKVRRKWSDRIKTLEMPLFPGYVFCRSQGRTEGLIISTPYVARIVSFSGRPSPIDDQEIEALRKMESSGAQPEPCSYPQIGERVQVKEGPLSGITGILVQIRNRRQLVISIDAIMKSVSVDIDSIEVLRCAALHPAQANAMIAKLN